MMLKHLMAVAAVSGVLLAAPPPAQANSVYDYSFNTFSGEVTGTITFASITGCSSNSVAPFCTATSVTVASFPADSTAIGSYLPYDNSVSKFPNFVFGVVDVFNIDSSGKITFAEFVGCTVSCFTTVPELDLWFGAGENLNANFPCEGNCSTIITDDLGASVLEGADNISITAATPLPAALPLFAGGLGALGLLGWRRKRKNRTAIAA